MIPLGIIAARQHAARPALVVIGPDDLPRPTRSMLCSEYAEHPAAVQCSKQPSFTARSVFVWPSIHPASHHRSADRREPGQSKAAGPLHALANDLPCDCDQVARAELVI